jgi:hypothetical protein
MVKAFSLGEGEERFSRVEPLFFLFEMLSTYYE